MSRRVARIAALCERLYLEIYREPAPDRLWTIEARLDRLETIYRSAVGL